MDALSSKSQLDMATNVHDLGSINTMREALANGDENVLKKAAEQFEAIFVRMMLKSMRQAQEVLADKDSPFNSEQVKFYRDMHDQQMAADLSSKGGLGLAELIEKQLGNGKDGYIPASVLRSDGELTSLNRDRVQQRLQAQEKVLNPATAGVKGAFKQAMFNSHDEFVAALYPHAVKAAEQLGTDPKAIIAQAAVETGWGQHVIHHGNGESSNNFFGIKANRHWQGEQAVVDTLEFAGGMPSQQKAAFRSYASVAEAMQDYVEFIKQQPRYSKAVESAHDANSYFNELQSAGYATDPNYANKVMSVLDSARLQTFLP